MATLRTKYKPRILFQDETTGTTLAVSFGTNNENYENVVRVRRFKTGQSIDNPSNDRQSIDNPSNDRQSNCDQRRLPDEHRFFFDPYSFHYVLYSYGKPVGGLCVTRNIDGEMDCRDYYPEVLFAAFNEKIDTACKLRIIPDAGIGFRGLRLLIREAWRDRLATGSRLNIVNATGELVRFYAKFGYITLEGADFVHPKLGTNSVVMVLPADPTRNSICHDLVQNIDDPLLLEDMLKALDLVP